MLGWVCQFFSVPFWLVQKGGQKECNQFGAPKPYFEPIPDWGSLTNGSGTPNLKGLRLASQWFPLKYFCQQTGGPPPDRCCMVGFLVALQPSRAETRLGICRSPGTTLPTTKAQNKLQHVGNTGLHTVPFCAQKHGFPCGVIQAKQHPERGRPKMGLWAVPFPSESSN